MNITAHGAKRVRQRIGIPKRAVERMAAKALLEGTPRTEFSGDFRKYLDKLFYDKGLEPDIRVLNGYIFFFSYESLVTTWAVPKSFRKTARNFVS